MLFRSDKIIEIRFKLDTFPGTINLIALLPYSFHTSFHIIEEKEEGKKPKEPTPFAMLLRKNLKGRILKNIEQINFDRIILLDFEDTRIYIEFFNRGNLVLTDNKNKIIAPMTGRETKERRIRKGEIYTPSKMEKIQPFPSELKESSQIKDVAKSFLSKEPEANLIFFLSKTINLPPFYLDEICFMAGINPESKLLDCDDKIYEKIFESIFDFMKDLELPTPIIYGDYKDYKYSVVKLKKFESKKIKGKIFPAFNQILDEVYHVFLGEVEDRETKAVKGKDMEKVLRKLEHQKTHTESLKKKEEENRTLAEKIIENQDLITELTEEYNKLKELKVGLKAEKLKEEKIEVTLITKMKDRLNERGIKSIKIEKGKIVLEF